MGVRGIIGKKIGMTQIFNESGVATSVTAVTVGPCTVTQIKTAGIDGYEGVQLGFDGGLKFKQKLCVFDSVMVPTSLIFPI